MNPSRSPLIYGRVRLGGHSLVTLCTCVIVVCFFTAYYARFLFLLLFPRASFPFFLSPYIVSIWSPISSVLSDVFASPMWAEINDVKAPSLCCLAEKLPEIVLGSRADSTTLTYLNGFKRWRAWANRFPEVAVLPATPAYVFLYLLSVLQRRSRTPSIAFAGLMILLV